MATTLHHRRLHHQKDIVDIGWMYLGIILIAFFVTIAVVYAYSIFGF